MKHMSMGPYPIEVALCLSVPEWRREMKARGDACRDVPYPTAQGNVSILVDVNGGRCCLVTFTPEFKQEAWLDQVGIVVHEATHVWQTIREHLNEQRPGDEIEACGVQWISKWLLEQLVCARWINE